jgi:hypothetical protein
MLDKRSTYILIHSDIPDMIEIHVNIHENKSIESIQNELIGSNLELYAVWELPICGFDCIKFVLSELYEYKVWYDKFLVNMGFKNVGFKNHNTLKLNKNDARTLISYAICEYLRKCKFDFNCGKYCYYTLENNIKCSRTPIDENYLKECRSRYLQLQLIDRHKSKLREYLNVEQVDIYSERISSYKLDELRSVKLEKDTLTTDKIINIDMTEPTRKSYFIDGAISQLKFELDILKTLKTRDDIKELNARNVGSEDFTPATKHQSKVDRYWHVMDTLEQLKKDNLMSLSSLIDACDFYSTTPMDMLSFQTLERSERNYIASNLKLQLKSKRLEIEEALQLEYTAKTTPSKKDWIMFIAAALFGLFILGSCISNSPTKSYNCYHKC